MCSSVQGAFGTALQGMMAWPGDRAAKPGDEVILTSVVWPWVLQGLRSYGLVPVFVDLDPETFCLDPKQLSQALSDKTRAVFLSYNGNTCPDITAVAGFCAKHDLRLIEGVCSSALGGKYDDKFMGTRGDFSVYFPKKPYSTWSLVLSRHEEMADLFSRILTGEGHDEELNLHHGAPGEAFQPDARFFHPSRAYGMGLSNAFKACGKWKAPISKLHGDFDAYADFFGAYSQYFDIPKPPAQARLGATAEAPGLHAVGRAAAVEVDLVVAPVGSDARSLRQQRGIAAPQLQRQRLFAAVEAEQALAIAVDDRVGVHHFRVQAHTRCQHAMEHAAMAIGPVHHGGNGQAQGIGVTGGGGRHRGVDREDWHCQ